MTDKQELQHRTVHKDEPEQQATPIATQVVAQKDGYFRPYVRIMFYLILMTLVIDVAIFIVAIVSLQSKKSPVAIISMVLFCISFVAMIIFAIFVWKMSNIYGQSPSRRTVVAPEVPAEDESGDMLIAQNPSTYNANWDIFMNIYTHVLCMYSGTVISLSVVSLIT